MRALIEKNAIAWAVARVEAKVIDRINILRASIQAMHNALRMLHTKPDFILVDGNRFYPYETIEHCCVIQGDSRYRAIAAASILAKTHRDEYMRVLHQMYPLYGWDQNKGYATEIHRNSITLHGITDEHRRSFKYVEEEAMQLELFD
jgi:ribonuclease HII